MAITTSKLLSTAKFCYKVTPESSKAHAIKILLRSVYIHVLNMVHSTQMENNPRVCSTYKLLQQLQNYSCIITIHNMHEHAWLFNNRLIFLITIILQTCTKTDTLNHPHASHVCAVYTW